MISYLEKLAPCIYLPGYDWAYSCVTPRVSDGVVVVGHIHSDSPDYYEHFARLGRYFNQTIVASEYLRSKLAAQYPRLAKRICVLPYGVSIPNHPPIRNRAASAPIHLLYAGRLFQEAKRVLDIPKIAEALVRRQVPVRLSFTGWGVDEGALRAACQHLSDRGLVQFHGMVSRDRLLEIYEENDVLILTSEYEGKPLSLIEGMGRACIPVVTDIRSGIPELVKDGMNGYVVPVGAIEQFADRLAGLHRDLNLRERLAAHAFETVSRGGYRIEDMVAAYGTLFERLVDETASGRFRRPYGRMSLPPHLPGRPTWDQPTWKDLLPERIRTIGKHCHGAIRRAARAPSALMQSVRTGTSRLSH
jgi:glycosyltransferase involved in cell wall biosynthesis